MFLPLALVSNVAMNIDVQVFVRVPAFTSFGYIPRNGTDGSYELYVQPLNFVDRLTQGLTKGSPL